MSNLVKNLRDARVALCGAGALFLVAGSAVSPAHAVSVYQNLNGTYPSLSDFVRDLNGTPCGIECTAHAERRWARESRTETSEAPGPSQYYGYYKQ
jgi:hypothetical protein